MSTIYELFVHVNILLLNNHKCMTIKMEETQCVRNDKNMIKFDVFHSSQKKLSKDPRNENTKNRKNPEGTIRKYIKFQDSI